MSALTQSINRKSASQVQDVSPAHYAAMIIMAAGGVDLETCVKIAIRMLLNPNINALNFAISAAIVPRKAAIVLGGEDPIGIANTIPEFIIPRRDGIRDTYNYSAFHITGQLILHFAEGHTHEKKINTMILSKAGDCIFDKYSSSSKGGAINSEIYKRWSREELDNARSMIEAAPVARHMARALIGIIPPMAELSKKWMNGEEVNLTNDVYRVTRIAEREVVTATAQFQGQVETAEVAQLD